MLLVHQFLYNKFYNQEREISVFNSQDELI